MLQCYRRHVAMQRNHWRHPHFRWRCVMAVIVFLRIILCCRFVCKQESLLKNIKLHEILKLSWYLWWQGYCRTNLVFLGPSIYCVCDRSFKINADISKTAIDKTQSKTYKQYKYIKWISLFLYCWFIHVMTMNLCKHFVHNALTRVMQSVCT